MKKYETNKLFYDKYLYKIEVQSSLAYIFRNNNLQAARDILDDLQEKLERKQPLVVRSYLKYETVAPKKLHEAQIIYTLLSKNVDYKLRIEKPKICIYSNDKQFLLQFDDKLEQDCKFFEPSDDVRKAIQNNPNIIVLKTPIPYEYRVTLGNQTSYEFLDWLKNNQDKVKASKKLLNYLSYKRHNEEGLYVYVRDSKIIQLLSLMNINIRRIDKIVCKQNLDK